MKKFILWHKEYGEIQRSEDGSITSGGAIGAICEDNVYLKAYAHYPDDRRPGDLGPGECIENVGFSLCGEKGEYDIYRIDGLVHPLISLLPTIRSICKSVNAKYRVERFFAQVTSIEIESVSGRLINIELDDDVPKHRSTELCGAFIETDAESLFSELTYKEE